ncbi:flagellar protein flhE [Winslowiella iniecta]|uniref:Flagellar protein flhE n=1 Tax=Winslowiella iniecta TaxID=1560201 RepID=A0A0L7T5W0_9GAMM|nr:flagellar protein flhE [Winslowiella iniecta]KOC90789.1 flagellar protein flhE [Winslowiella iniecta]
MRLTLLILLWLPTLALAASGGWSASGTGASLSQRGVQASSPALSPPSPVNGMMTEVYWRYLLTGPTPAGMQVRLCSSTRCAAIEGSSGSTRGLSNVPANESLRFVFYVEGKGRLFPVLRVLSNQVMVNYQG